MRRLLVVALFALGVVPAGAAHALPSSPTPRPEGTVAAGFTDSVVTAGVATPTALVAVPDGRVVVLQKTGSVRINHEVLAQHRQVAGGSGLLQVVGTALEELGVGEHAQAGGTVARVAGGDLGGDEDRRPSRQEH